MKNLGQYDIDLIAKRDRMQKIRSSVIKRWNVTYEPLEDEETADGEAPEDSGIDPEVEAENLRKAQEIIDRLNAEAAEDEAIKQQEINQAKAVSEATFNATTGSNSGAYGQGEVNEDDRMVIDSIMAEKDDALHHLIEETAAGS